MGSGASTPAGGPRGALGARARLDDPSRAPAKKGALLAALQRSGRYASFTTPSGATVHLLGVMPACTRSEEEVHDLIAAVAPTHVYLDLVPEWVAALQQEVAAGRVGEWAIPDATPPYRVIPGAGIVGSVLIRNQLADNDLLGLCGAEWFGPWKVALAAAERLRKAAAAAAAAAGGEGSGAGPTVLAYPYSMHYNNGETLDRPSAMTALLVGNNSFASDAVHLLVGNNAAIMGGDKAEVEFTAATPATGYFTRQQVNDLQRAFRERGNAFLAAATAASADVESDLSAREAAAREGGREADAQLYAFAALKSQVQAQAVAHTLQAAGEAAGAGAHVVAVVNLGALASLTRNWAEAQPPTVLIPPIGPLMESLGYIAPTLLAGSLGYGFYRGFRRFPKTTGVVGVLAASAASVFAYNVVYSDGMRYGFGVRAALARPRVTSPLAGMRK